VNGIHDMGGMDGFGPVVAEANEPVFHAPWESRVFAFTRAFGYAGAWTLDESRATQERLPPQVYLTVSYYKRWALGFERLLVKHGLVSAEELAAGRSMTPGYTPWRKLEPQRVPATLRRSSFTREPRGPARRTYIQPVRRVFHAMRADTSARWSACRAVTFIRIPSCSAKATIPNGSIPSCSTVALYGARSRTPA
jgi:hypothetical protein